MPIAVTRAERDALYPECLLGLDGAAPDLSTREDVRAYQHRLALFVHLRDDLGWDADDRRGTFAITVAHDEARAWLTELRAAAIDCVRLEHQAMRTVLDGDPSWFEEGERERSVRESKAIIDEELEAIHACDAILARIDALAGDRRRLLGARREARRARSPAAAA